MGDRLIRPVPFWVRSARRMPMLIYVSLCGILRRAQGHPAGRIARKRVAGHRIVTTLNLGNQVAVPSVSM